MWIKIRATAEDKQRWQHAAESAGVSLSELVRSRLDGYRVKAPRSKRTLPSVDPGLLRGLARVGNNLNQLARAANGQRPVAAAAICA